MTEERTLQDQVHILIDGESAPDLLLQGLMRVAVEQGLHLPSLCTLRVQDDDLSLVDSATLDVGRSLVVQMGSGRELRRAFEGEITGLELEPTPAGTLTLVVRAYDRSHRLHRGRKTQSYQQMTDSDLATRIAREAGLDPDVESTSEVYEYVLQDNRTPYEFLRERAERIGFAFWVSEGKLHFRRPAARPPEPIPLEWGHTLHQFHPVLSACRQVDEVLVRGWDPLQKRPIVGRATRGRAAPELGEQRTGSELARQAFGSASVLVVDRPVSTQGEADTLAQALADQLSAEFVRAEARCAGDARLCPGALVEIRNVGQRFSGKYYVTRAVHSFGQRGVYQTELTVAGNQTQTLFDLLQPPAGRSLWIGPALVTDNRDPAGMGRIKVQIPWLGDQVESTWARPAVPMAGSERGIFFLPEVGDEVLVTFEHGDVNHPYVLGALWNGREEPPNAASAVNRAGQVVQRVIRTRAGHTILLDDTDGGGGITIEDRSGNKIYLDTARNTLRIEVLQDVTIEAQGKVAIKALTGIDLEASGGQVNVKGIIVNLNS
ncbi:MAG: VgrG-related protein [Chloroflexia bacterium]